MAKASAGETRQRPPLRSLRSLSRGARQVESETSIAMKPGRLLFLKDPTVSRSIPVDSTLAAGSRNRRRKTGQITCYQNRTDHLLPPPKLPKCPAQPKILRPQRPIRSKSENHEHTRSTVNAAPAVWVTSTTLRPGHIGSSGVPAASGRLRRLAGRPRVRDPAGAPARHDGIYPRFGLSRGLVLREHRAVRAIGVAPGGCGVRPSSAPPRLVGRALRRRAGAGRFSVDPAHLEGRTRVRLRRKHL